jgi:hypothetical protein
MSLLTNVSIVEYDMQDAGFSIIKEHKLLSPAVINQLEQVPKAIRTVQIGQLQKEDTLFGSALTEMFAYHNQKFIEDNQLDETSILRITRDSIMTVNKTCVHQIIDGIFYNKNCYGL